MSIKRTGNWNGVTNLINNLDVLMQAAKVEALERFALKAEKTAVEHISNQDLGWAALKPATLARKIREGFSENILVETSTYFQNITSWVDGDTAYIGVRRGVKETNGADVSTIAAVHEFGSTVGNIPARQLWHPTFEETMEWGKLNNDPAKIFRQKAEQYK